MPEIKGREEEPTRFWVSVDQVLRPREPGWVAGGWWKAVRVCAGMGCFPMSCELTDSPGTLSRRADEKGEKG